MRSTEGQSEQVDAERFPFVDRGDRKRSFLKDAAVHVVNMSSVR